MARVARQDGQPCTGEEDVLDARRKATKGVLEKKNGNLKEAKNGEHVSTVQI